MVNILPSTSSHPHFKVTIGGAEWFEILEFANVHLVLQNQLL
jgi:hypothetical protein